MIETRSLPARQSHCTIARMKASAEQFEDQGPACLRELRRILPAIACNLSLVRSLSHSEHAG